MNQLELECARQSHILPDIIPGTASDVVPDVDTDSDTGHGMGLKSLEYTSDSTTICNSDIGGDRFQDQDIF